jgi:hypothetical protein
MKSLFTWMFLGLLTTIGLISCSKSEVLTIVSFDDNYGNQVANTITTRIDGVVFTSDKTPISNDTTVEYGSGAFLVNNGKALLIVGIADFQSSFQRIHLLINLKTGSDIRGEYTFDVKESSELNGFRNYGVWSASVVQLTYPNPIGIVGFTSKGRVTITNKTDSTVNGRFEFVQGYAGAKTNVTKGTFYKLAINS